MKVRELIEALSDMPGDADVFFADYACEWAEVTNVSMMDNISVYDPVEEVVTDHQNVAAIF